MFSFCFLIFPSLLLSSFFAVDRNCAVIVFSFPLNCN
jgi:hypothetical protein